MKLKRKGFFSFHVLKSSHRAFGLQDEWCVIMPETLVLVWVYFINNINEPFLKYFGKEI